MAPSPWSIGSGVARTHYRRASRGIRSSVDANGDAHPSFRGGIQLILGNCAHHEALLRSRMSTVGPSLWSSPLRMSSMLSPNPILAKSFQPRGALQQASYDGPPRLRLDFTKAPLVNLDRHTGILSAVDVSSGICSPSSGKSLAFETRLHVLRHTLAVSLLRQAYSSSRANCNTMNAGIPVCSRSNCSS